MRTSLDHVVDDLLADTGTQRRRRTLLTTGLLLTGLLAVLVAGTVLADSATTTSLGERNQPPSWSHPFGTDWLGRDMLHRTLAGLRLSLLVGLVASVASAVIAFVLAAVATLNRWADSTVGWLVDLFLAMPHLVLLILIAVVLGGGLPAVIVAVGLTHWPTLTRVLRGEARRVTAADYTLVARRLGRSRWWVARHHVSRHLVAQFAVGLVLLFPHAILHEAALSFLGIGVDPGQPAVGIILSESMRYLSTGAWWLAVLPGLSLLALVKAVDTLGEQVRTLADPRSHHL